MELLPVHIEKIERRKERSKWGQILFNWAITIGLLVLCVVLTEFFQRYLFVGENLIMMYLLVVLIISSLTPGYLTGFISAILATLTYNYLVIEPKYVFNFSYKLIFTVVAMLIVTVASSFIAAYLKQQTKYAIERERKISLLYRMHQELSKSRSIKEIAEAANAMLVQQAGKSVVFYFKEPQKDSLSYCTVVDGDMDLNEFNTKEEIRNARHVFEDKKPTDLSGPYGDDLNVYYYPIYLIERSLGVVGVSLKKGHLSESDIRFLKLLLSQVAPVLEILLREEEQRQVQIETEKEKMRNNLLRSVSHDLRTPLTSILGAATTLDEEYHELDRQTHRELTENIKKETQWLIRMVENLLTVTRIMGSPLDIQKTPESAEEVLAQAVGIVRSRFPDRSILVKVPDDLLTVPMDATLISQVIINLTENAIKNSDDKSLIFVNLKEEDSHAVFEVSDEGKGISREMESRLFKRHEEPIDASQGLGIGLSICDSIVQAHSGKIKGENKEEGGAIFSFWLPMEDEIDGELTTGINN